MGRKETIAQRSGLGYGLAMSIPNTSAASALQTFRVWFKAMGSDAGLTDDQVVLAERGSQRPALPYVTLKRLSDRSLGDPERISDTDGSGDPRLYTLEPREMLVSVQSYGEEAEEWLERAIAARSLPASTALLDGISVRPAGGVRNISQLLSGITWEQRSSLDVRVTYQRSTLLTAAETPGELAEVAITGELQRLDLDQVDPDALPLDFTAP